MASAAPLPRPSSVSPPSIMPAGAPSSRLLVNDTDILHAVTAAGLGIGLLPAFRCVEDLRARRLERVLRDWSAPATPIHVVYPSTRFVSPVVKSFVEHLQARMTPPPWELGGDLTRVR
jgi:DNA-binding transcriptional LysR family regulator